MNKSSLALAAGVFFGNWLVVPLFFHKTFTDGFFTGLIAIPIVLVLCKVFGRR